MDISKTYKSFCDAQIECKDLIDKKDMKSKYSISEIVNDCFIKVLIKVLNIYGKPITKSDIKYNGKYLSCFIFTTLIILKNITDINEIEGSLYDKYMILIMQKGNLLYKEDECVDIFPNIYFIIDLYHNEFKHDNIRKLCVNSLSGIIYHLCWYLGKYIHSMNIGKETVEVDKYITDERIIHSFILQLDDDNTFSIKELDQLLMIVNKI
jgi:hypothetical protein